MLRNISIGFVLVLALAACAGSAAGTTAADPPAEVVEGSSVPESPLEAELGFPSEPARRQYQLLSLQRDADAALVQCMRDAGFFYAVTSGDEALRSGVSVGDGSREWAATEGLGITSSFVEALSIGAAQASPDVAETNLGYVASLSDEESNAYDLALVGEIGVSTTSAGFEPAGCWGAAFRELLGLVNSIAEFGPELAELNVRLTADPRVQGFQQTWSACMQTAGYRYTNEAAMIDDVYARLLAIELVDVQGATRVALPDALDELAEFERMVGVASYDCQRSYTIQATQLRNDYEREFLDDNRFRIAEMQPPAQ